MSFSLLKVFVQAWKPPAVFIYKHYLWLVNWIQSKANQNACQKKAGKHV